MLKIKLKHTNLLDFVSSSLFFPENDKLSWNSYWHKNSSYKCIHISALQSRKLRLRESTRLILSSLLLLGFASLNVPPWLLSKTFLYTLRTFQSNRILTMSIFSPFILNGYKRIKMYWKTLPHVLKILQIYQGLVSIEINHFK